MVLCMTESQAYSIAWTRHDVHRTILYRSEEHTSELQSHLNLVCRLLLEKKKNTNELQSHLNLVCRLLIEKKNNRHERQCNNTKIGTRSMRKESHSIDKVMCDIIDTQHTS